MRDSYYVLHKENDLTGFGDEGFSRLTEAFEACVNCNPEEKPCVECVTLDKNDFGETTEVVARECLVGNPGCVNEYYRGPRINLTKDDRTYANHLHDRYDDIKDAYYDRNVSVEEFKDYVKSIADEGSFNYKAKPRFMMKVDSMHSKDEIITYVTNAIIAASNYDPSEPKDESLAEAKEYTSGNDPIEEVIRKLSSILGYTVSKESALKSNQAEPNKWHIDISSFDDYSDGSWEEPFVLWINRDSSEYENEADDDEHIFELWKKDVKYDELVNYLDSSDCPFSCDVTDTDEEKIKAKLFGPGKYDESLTDDGEEAENDIEEEEPEEMKAEKEHPEEDSWEDWPEPSDEDDEKDECEDGSCEEPEERDEPIAIDVFNTDWNIEPVKFGDDDDRATSDDYEAKPTGMFDDDPFDFEDEAEKEVEPDEEWPEVKDEDGEALPAEDAAKAVEEVANEVADKAEEILDASKADAKKLEKAVDEIVDEKKEEILPEEEKSEDKEEDKPEEKEEPEEDEKKEKDDSDKDDEKSEKEDEDKEDDEKDDKADNDKDGKKSDEDDDDKSEKTAKRQKRMNEAVCKDRKSNPVITHPEDDEKQLNEGELTEGPIWNGIKQGIKAAGQAIRNGRIEADSAKAEAEANKAATKSLEQAKNDKQFFDKYLTAPVNASKGVKYAITFKRVDEGRPNWVKIDDATSKSYETAAAKAIELSKDPTSDYVSVFWVDKDGKILEGDSVAKFSHGALATLKSVYDDTIQLAIKTEKKAAVETEMSPEEKAKAKADAEKADAEAEAAKPINIAKKAFNDYIRDNLKAKWDSDDSIDDLFPNADATAAAEAITVPGDADAETAKKAGLIAVRNFIKNNATVNKYFEVSKLGHIVPKGTAEEAEAKPATAVEFKDPALTPELRADLKKALHDKGIDVEFTEAFDVKSGEKVDELFDANITGNSIGVGFLGGTGMSNGANGLANGLATEELKDEDDMSDEDFLKECGKMMKERHDRKELTEEIPSNDGLDFNDLDTEIEYDDLDIDVEREVGGEPIPDGRHGGDDVRYSPEETQYGKINYFWTEIDDYDTILRLVAEYLGSDSASVTQEDVDAIDKDDFKDFINSCDWVRDEVIDRIESDVRDGDYENYRVDWDESDDEWPEPYDESLNEEDDAEKKTLDEQVVDWINDISKDYDVTVGKLTGDIDDLMDDDPENEEFFKRAKDIAAKTESFHLKDDRDEDAWMRLDDIMRADVHYDNGEPLITDDYNYFDFGDRMQSFWSAYEDDEIDHAEIINGEVIIFLKKTIADERKEAKDLYDGASWNDDFDE